MNIVNRTASGVYRHGMTSGGTGVRHIDDDGGFQENYEALANAIIIQAVKDYKDHLRSLIKHPRSREAVGKAMDIEKFFHSAWYEMLTDLDPDRLISGVREMVKDEEAERQRKHLERIWKQEEKQRQEVKRLLLFLEGRKGSGSAVSGFGLGVLKAMASDTREVTAVE